ncbi:MAG: DUF2155 domain-containing protein [Proteobacteria bacterium]|jgi:hypothetical protein|nr:DUF2155 domain-containing protein [Pseudomonadota bacterium]MDA0995470.1 DUF2155 domain-containing protein [Pseudomonadota bacterium]
MESRVLVFFLFFLLPSKLLAVQENISIFNTTKNSATVVILDKITSKKTTHPIKIETPYKINSLEILVKRCVLDNSKGSLEIMTYLQVQDSSRQIQNKDKVFIFNGWIFSKHPSVNAFEHPNYDIWVESCS